MTGDAYWSTDNLIYGDEPIAWNEQEPDEDDPLWLNMYTYIPDIKAITQSGTRYIYALNSPLKYSGPFENIAIADDAVIVLVVAGGAAYTAAVVWAQCAEGQQAIQGTIEGIINGVSYVGDALDGAVDAVTSWVQQASITSAKAGSGISEHTKPRAGRPTEGKKLHPNWLPRNS